MIRLKVVRRYQPYIFLVEIHDTEAPVFIEPAADRRGIKKPGYFDL